MENNNQAQQAQQSAPKTNPPKRSLPKQEGTKKDKQNLFQQLSPVLNNILNNISMNTSFASSTEKAQYKANAELKSIKQEIQKSNDHLKNSADLAQQKKDFDEERLAEQAKEKEEAQAKQQDLQKNQNAEIITQLKGLHKSLDELDISSGKGGGGGFLDGLLSVGKGLFGNLIPMAISALGGLVSTIVPLLGAILANPVFLTLVAAAVGALAGYGIYKYFIEPLIDQYHQEQRKAMNIASTEKRFQSKDEKGENLYYQKDAQGIERIVPESTIAQQAKEKNISTEEYVKQNDIRKVEGKKDALGNIISGKEIMTPQDISAAESKTARNTDLMPKYQNAKAFSETLEWLKTQDTKNKTPQEKQEIANKAFTRFSALAGADLTEESANNYKKRLEQLINDPESLDMTIQSEKGNLRTIALEKAKDRLKSIYDSIYAKAVNEDSSPKYYSSEEQAREVALGIGKLMGDMAKIIPTRPQDNPNWPSPQFKGLLPEDADTLKKYFPFNPGELQIQTALNVGALIKNKKKKGYYIDLMFRKNNFGEIQEGDPNFKIIPKLNDLQTPPQAASGAVVYPKTGKGVLTNISEDMKPEAVVPLDKYVISEKEVNGKDNSDKLTTVIRTTALDEKDASRQMMQPIVINNNTTTGSQHTSDGGVNFQYQTNMAKTFESVYEMILFKNMKPSIS